MITQEELQELSRKVSELYKVEPYTIEYCNFNGDTDPFLLHDDWAVLMDLAVENGIDIAHYPKFQPTWVSVACMKVIEKYADHTDPKQATRVAIMKALIAIKIVQQSSLRILMMRLAKLIL